MASNVINLAGPDHRMQHAYSIKPHQKWLKKSLQKMSTRITTVCAGLTGALLMFIFLALPQIMRVQLRRDYTWYDLGRSGFAPTRKYQSFDHPVVEVEFIKQDASCSDDYIFFAPHGPKVDEPGGIIMDARGELIWRQPGLDGAVQDLRVQEYRGEKFLTFWLGLEEYGRKMGSWYMLDETYQVRHHILPSRFKRGDMHEFHLTENGTALVTIYVPIQADLSSIGGAKDGFVLDCIFQEINIQTGESLFEWHSWDHVRLDATFKSLTPCTDNPNSAYGGCGNTAESAFDYYHLNSVQKDKQGNYLVSGRSTFALSYLDGRTGNVIWTLGGVSNDFRDLSNGAATSFAWQHHATFHNDGTTISILNNGAHAYFDTAAESCGMMIDIDTNNFTATLVREYIGPQGLRSFSQGNLQVLQESGNVFVGWGRDAAFTEFAANGEVLCDARYGASAFFSFGLVMSYRVFRDKWVGKPNYPPSIAINKGKIYASWNGATEVAKWRLEEADADELDEENFQNVGVTLKTGFETEILPSAVETYAFVRVVALNENNDVLGASEVVEMRYDGSLFRPIDWLGLALVVILGSCILVYIQWAKRCERKKNSGRYKLVEGDSGDERDGSHHIWMEAVQRGEGF